MTLTPMSISGLAERLAAVTAEPESYHARQLRAQVREGVLQPYARGGEGATAPALFNESGLCRAMILHTLALLGVQTPILRDASAAMSVVDPRTRKGGAMESSDGIDLAIGRIRAGQDMFLHLDFHDWPGEDGDLRPSGWVSHLPTPHESKALPPVATIVLPLHRTLKPLLGIG